MNGIIWLAGFFVTGKLAPHLSNDHDDPTKASKEFPSNYFLVTFFTFFEASDDAMAKVHFALVRVFT